jgi:hypothetical protein
MLPTVSAPSTCFPIYICPERIRRARTAQEQETSNLSAHVVTGHPDYTPMRRWSPRKVRRDTIHTKRGYATVICNKIKALAFTEHYEINEQRSERKCYGNLGSRLSAPPSSPPPPSPPPPSPPPPSSHRHHLHRLHLHVRHLLPRRHRRRRRPRHHHRQELPPPSPPPP